MNTSSKTTAAALFILLVVAIALAVSILAQRRAPEPGEGDVPLSVNTFDECVAAGNPVMESYPRQCRHGEQTFVEEVEQIVGGDADVHGCIGSAGYSWCALKETCLRIWEESCYESVEEEIRYLLAETYNTPVEDVTVTITKETDNHVAGQVWFSPESSVGGMFLAVRAGNMWEVVYDGNGSVDCTEMRDVYGFSDDMLVPDFCDE